MGESGSAKADCNRNPRGFERKPLGNQKIEQLKIPVVRQS